MLGYGHSTGAPVILDYIMANGDGAFAGFIFNSPFLDWGRVGGWLNKRILQHAPALLTSLRIWKVHTSPQISPHLPHISPRLPRSRPV